MENGKQCRTCGALQPLDAFYRDNSREDGRRNSCVSCDKARKRSPEVREQSHRYYHSEKGKAAERKYYHEGNGREVRKAYNERPDVKEKRKARASAATLRYLATDKGRAYLERRKTDPRAQTLRRAASRRSQQRRTARQRDLEATLTEGDWLRALEHFDGCAYCGTAGSPLHQDHFIPLALGGPYTADNIAPSCQSCNRQKRERMPRDWCSPESYERITRYFAALGATPPHERPLREPRGKAHGDRHPAAKLTQVRVDEIRERYAAGGVTQTALATQFGVDQTTISRIIRGKAWA